MLENARSYMFLYPFMLLVKLGLEQACALEVKKPKTNFKFVW